MLESHIAIKATNIGKCYQVYESPLDRFKQILFPQRKYYSEAWALQNVSFEINKGDSLGIIGRNGSGKSTLLQILCKTLTPTTGEFHINGRISALLELGAGFNPEFTGRENVYLNGALIGFSAKEMAARFDKIAEFADIGNYIDKPVKTYSSGMFVRLAFAVQVSTDPDILIVDEALSVGDIFFQQKCAERMQELREKGTTLIFVSHDMASVRDLCKKALYLKAGQLIYSGDCNEAIRRYFTETNEQICKSISAPMNYNSSLPIITQFKEQAYWVKDDLESDKKANEIIAISVTDITNTPTLKVQMGSELKFHVLFRSTTEQSLGITLALRNRYNHLINSSGFKITDIHSNDTEYKIFEFHIQCMIEAGLYTFAIQLTHPLDIPNRGTVFDKSPWLGPITITWDYENQSAPWYGMFGIPIQGNSRILTDKNELTTS